MISLILFFISGIFDAAKDIISFRYEQSVFAKLNPIFWNPLKSWKNKYRRPIIPGDKHWYYFGLYTPAMEERFPYSTTLFVGLTDGWHLLKTMYLICTFLGVYFYKPIVGTPADFFLCWIAYSLSFNLFIEKIFNRVYWKYK